ncbi:MAG: hypothetical protein SNJ64_06145 [Endomicrobiia bacterium]
MTTNQIKEIIHRNKNDIAFLVGNGVNRFPDNPNALSWDDLLIKLWDKVSLQTLSSRPNGISLTEFYDILELQNTQEINLQKEVADLMRTWQPLQHHSKIINRIKEIDAPVLTTNFDETLARTIEYKLFRTEQERFTDFYPWSTYHGITQLDLPTDGFAIWYINGMIHYHRSIRLGLSHYMGSVQRARNLLVKDKESLFSENNILSWNGYKTWLHIVFNKSLFIFGLGLEENEIFLRWILIERIKYFNKFPNRKHKGWYINKKSNNDTDQGKRFFLEKIGFEVIDVNNYADIYENIWT